MTDSYLKVMRDIEAGVYGQQVFPKPCVVCGDEGYGTAMCWWLCETHWHRWDSLHRRWNLPEWNRPVTGVDFGGWEFFVELQRMQS